MPQKSPPRLDLPAVAAAILADFDRLSTRVRDAVWRQLPGYEDTVMRRADLDQTVRPNLRAALAALAEERRPRPDELRTAARLGEQRALQGVPLEAVDASWRTAERTVVDALLMYADRLPPAVLRRATATLAAAFDDLVRATTETYHRTRVEVTERFEWTASDLVSRLAGTERVDPQEVASVARAVEVDPDQPFVAVALGAPPAAGLAVRQMYRHAVASIAPQASGRILSGTHRGHVMLLVPIADERALAGMLQRALDRQEVAATVLAGVGEPQPDLAGVGTSCGQADAAFDVGLRTGAYRRAVRYADVLVEVLLLRNRTVARRLVDTRLGPLAARPQFLVTLRAYLANGQSVRRTAEALGVHQNTVAYRLGRARELVGDGRDGLDGLLDLAVALKARDLLDGAG
nr:helix-turn-helix domain-containing protein [Planosporangium flavigriseum]